MRHKSIRARTSRILNAVATLAAASAAGTNELEIQTDIESADSLVGGSSSPPCARALLLVAHPDDETLFAGEILLGRVAALPGGCRHAFWHVICVTNGDIPDRRQDFRRALLMARAHGLASSISMEIWDYTDCNLPFCMQFPGGDDVPFLDRLELALSGRTTGNEPWDFVVTHNPHGEYHHMQHIGLYNAVAGLIEKGAVAGKPVLLVFNPMPELNVSMSVGKRRMANSYFTGPHVQPPRFLLFQSLTKYAENLVQARQGGEFPRSQILGLGYFQGAMHQGRLHYSYTWALARYKDWGDLGDFSADRAIPFVKEYLATVYIENCEARDESKTAWYPVICNKLRHSLRARGIGNQHIQLQVMENALEALFNPPDSGQDDAEASPAAEVALGPDCERCCAGGGPSIGQGCVSDDAECLAFCSPPSEPSQVRCLHWAPPFESVGTVSGWEVVGEGSGQVWVELIVVRPILVGWRQGYKAKTFRVVGSSGPALVDMSAGRRNHVLQPGPGIPVQPHDQIAWGVFMDSSGSIRTTAAPQKAAGSEESVKRRLEAMCLGSKGCDHAGLCAFDTPRAEFSSAETGAISQILPKLQPRQLLVPARRYSLRPALDISKWLEPTTTYEELLTLRHQLEDPDLQLFEDKIRLRRELLPSVGVASTPSIHLSNSDFEVARHITGLPGFVVKPSHMSESQNVFVVQNGINLLQQAWGFPHPVVTPEQIQAQVNTFPDTTALDWECKALVSVRPGVVVEELVLAEDSQGKLRVDEYKFYVAWGEVMFGENVPFSSGAALEIARDGTILSAVVPCPPMCVAPCYHRMVQLAEQVARGARTDYLRVDFLVHGRCEDVFVSEVELFPASDFSPELKAKVAERWRWGYGF